MGTFRKRNTSGTLRRKARSLPSRKARSRGQSGQTEIPMSSLPSTARVANSLRVCWSHRYDVGHGVAVHTHGQDQLLLLYLLRPRKAVHVCACSSAGFAGCSVLLTGIRLLFRKDLAAVDLGEIPVPKEQDENNSREVTSGQARQPSTTVSSK